jgi:predicted RNA-binding Zn-ribbon protein involved in translation (DUF1610 family)
MDEKNYTFIYCPNCGSGFKHEISNTGKAVGGFGGMAAGAALGAKIGIVGGPFGAMAGTIPGAILGGLFGFGAGKNYDKPQCPNCGVSFAMSSN